MRANAATLLCAPLTSFFPPLSLLAYFFRPINWKLLTILRTVEFDAIGDHFRLQDIYTMNTPTHTTFRHDLRLPGQPILPYTSDNNQTPPVMMARQPINQQVRELQQLLGENEQLINKNIRGLESITLKWDVDGGRGILAAQTNLDSIQHELFSVLLRLEARYKRQNIPGRRELYLPLPVADHERDKTLDLTYAALTAGNSVDPLASLMDRGEPDRMAPQVRRRVDNLVERLNDVVSVVPQDAPTQEVVAELMVNVEEMIDAFNS